MKEVTMKSTKQEIMDALVQARAELEKRSTIVSDPTAADKKTEEETIIAEAAAAVEENIFSDEVNAKYQNLVEAIKILEDRLAAQYGVEKKLLDMVTATNAAKELRLRQEKEYHERQEEIKEAIRQLSAEEAARRKEVDESVEEYRRNAIAARDREEEEYQYDLARNRKKAEDLYSDQKAEVVKDLEALKAEKQAFEEDLDRRKDEIETMRSAVEDMPKLLEEAHTTGYEEGEKAAGKEYGYKKNLAEKEHEFEIRERDNKITRLENDVDQKGIKIEALEEKLDAAYSQLRELATKTVESNGGIKVLTSDNGNKK